MTVVEIEEPVDIRESGDINIIEIVAIMCAIYFCS